MATSQTPEPHRHPVADRAPADHNRPDGNPTTPPAEPAAPPRAPLRRHTSGNRRTTIDTHTQAAIQAAIERLVADAPPLSEQTRERLAALLSTTTYRPEHHQPAARRRGHP